MKFDPVNELGTVIGNQIFHRACSYHADHLTWRLLFEGLQELPATDLPLSTGRLTSPMNCSMAHHDG